MQESDSSEKNNAEPLPLRASALALYSQGGPYDQVGTAMSPVVGSYNCSLSAMSSWLVTLPYPISASSLVGTSSLQDSFSPGKALL